MVVLDETAAGRPVCVKSCLMNGKPSGVKDVEPITDRSQAEVTAPLLLEGEAEKRPEGHPTVPDMRAGFKRSAASSSNGRTPGFELGRCRFESCWSSQSMPSSPSGWETAFSAVRRRFESCRGHAPVPFRRMGGGHAALVSTGNTPDFHSGIASSNLACGTR